MAIKPYVPFEVFKANNPVLNHSFRVYLVKGTSTLIVYDLWVTDGVITNTIVYDLSVTDAEIVEEAVPLVGFSLGSMNFGEVILEGDGDTMEVILTNTGTADLTITGITASGDFEVESVD